MTGKKSTANVKPEAKAADTMTEEVKTVPAEEVKNEEPKKTRGRKASAKTTATEKKTASKTTKASKTTAKKAVEATVVLQFGGKEYTREDLVKIAKDVWKYDLKRKVGDFKSVELYVKPEESVVYYVINGDVEGSFTI